MQETRHNWARPDCSRLVLPWRDWGRPDETQIHEVTLATPIRAGSSMIGLGYDNTRLGRLGVARRHNTRPGALRRYVQGNAGRDVNREDGRGVSEHCKAGTRKTRLGIVRYGTARRVAAA